MTDLSVTYKVEKDAPFARAMPSYNHRFLALSLLSGSILRWAIHRSKATAGQFNLTLEVCRDLPLPLPPFPEQQRIIEEVDWYLSVTDDLEFQIRVSLEHASRLRQSILKRAFEGKLVPQDPNDEPASVLLERIRASRAASSAARPGNARGASGNHRPRKPRLEAKP